jgi:hypothetical protein
MPILWHRTRGGSDLISRSELALLIFVVLVVVFLFWSRNVIVRGPVNPTPTSVELPDHQHHAHQNRQAAEHVEPGAGLNLAIDAVARQRHGRA